MQEDPTCLGATKIKHRSYRACALERGVSPSEPMCLNYRGLNSLEPLLPQQEKPLPSEAQATQRGAPARHNWRKPVHSKEDPEQPNK